MGDEGSLLTEILLMDPIGIVANADSNHCFR
jgi:hypothetical protein